MLVHLFFLAWGRGACVYFCVLHPLRTRFLSTHTLVFQLSGMVPPPLLDMSTLSRESLVALSDIAKRVQYERVLSYRTMALGAGMFCDTALSAQQTCVYQATCRSK